MAIVVLRDGRVAEFRAARRTAADKEKLVQLFQAGSDESRYLRFFRVVQQVREADIDNMLFSDGVEQFTLICTLENRAIGVGTYTRTAPEVAEVAFFIPDKDQGRGIGTLLLEHLATVAWEFGFRRFEAGVLKDNYRMQRVFLSSGYEVTTKRDVDSVRMALPLHASERTRSLAELREKHAVAASIRPFLQPKSIAVIGVSRARDSLGQLMFRHIIDSDYRGTVYPVNPHAASIVSVRAYASIQDIPEGVDLAVLIVPASTVPTVAAECVARGVGAMLVVSSGFAERDAKGVELQHDLMNQLRAAGCRLIGPNSLGVVNTKVENPLNCSLVPSLPQHGRLAIASQSGALGIAILAYATRTGIGVSSFVSTGNRADISSNDLLQYWEDDADTRTIALYLESFGNPRKFSRIARRITRRKPVVAVKSARSSAGHQASDMSRTALHANDTVVDALFHQTGIIRVDTLPELFDVAALLTAVPLPNGRRVAVVTNSAGGAVMAVDALDKFGLQFIAPVLDLGSEALAEGYASVLPALLRDELVDAILVVYIPIAKSVDDEITRVVVEAMEGAKQEGCSKPVIMNCLVTADSMVHLYQHQGQSVPIFPFPEQAVRALGHVASYAAYLRQPVGRVPDLTNMNVDNVQASLTAFLEREPDGADSQATLVPTAVLDTILTAAGMCSAYDANKAMVTLEAILDPLFGPVLRLSHDDETHAAVERIIPLTDLDADKMVAAVMGDIDVIRRQGWVDQLLRVSRLMDEVHALVHVCLKVCEVTDIDVTKGMAATTTTNVAPRFVVHLPASHAEVSNVYEATSPYR